MRKFSKKILQSFIPAICLLSAYRCEAQPYSTVTSFDYSKKKKQTVYAVVPFGNVTLPGKWKQQHYDNISKQQWISNVQDSLLIAVSLVPCDRFEFNEKGTKTGFDFVKAYYDWEADYFVKESGLNATLIEEDSTKSYRIMHVFGDSQGKRKDVYILLAANECAVRNIQLGYAPKYREEEKLAFLKSLLPEK